MLKALGWAAVVFVVVVAFLVLSLALSFPWSARLHALCLPFDWSCGLTDDAATVSTADATWWLVPATIAGAAATFAAVMVALFQDRGRARAEDRERTRINRAAKQAVLNAYDHCRKVATAITNLTQSDPDLAWDLYGKAAAHRRTLEHYLGTRISNDVIVYQCNAAIERLREVCVALDGVAKKTPERLAKAKGGLASVRRRIDDDEPDLIDADVDVTNGVVRVTVKASASF